MLRRPAASVHIRDEKRVDIGGIGHCDGGSVDLSCRWDSFRQRDKNQMSDSMQQKLADLEAASRLLEPASNQRSQLTDSATEHAEEFLSTLEDRAAYDASEEPGAALDGSPIAEDPIAVDQALALFSESVVRPGIAPASPKHFGYVPGGGIYHSAIADYLAAVSNKYAGAYFAGPGAVRMERMVVKWMAQFLGYPETAAGDLTSGGSIANLLAIITARESAELKARHFENSPIYITAHTHHSVMKAMMCAGVRECPVREIVLDQQMRMDAEALESMIAADLAAGLNPWLIIATAGSTDVGAVDPLPEIADIAAENGVWLHVDGAYGAPFALCASGKAALAGIERADSITIDPHKGLFLPYGSGALVVREGAKLRNAFRFDAHYMQDMPAPADTDDASAMDMSLELSRHYRGLRLWLPLQLVGVKPFRAALEEKMLLARHFHARVSEIDGFEVGMAPDLSIVTFRYLPKAGDPNDFNKKLVNAIQDDGECFISSTRIDDKFMLRLAVLCFRSHREHVDRFVDILLREIGRLRERSPFC